MAVFENTQKMYEVLGSLFETLLKDPDAGPKYVNSGIIIKFAINNPDGAIWHRQGC